MTSAKLYLPRATGFDHITAEQPASLTVEGGHEVVLVVEDDALVRKYVLTQVGSLGHTILEAGNAAEALVAIDNTEWIDLLFTDVIMPGSMNGRQLADEALKRRPL